MERKLLEQPIESSPQEEYAKEAEIRFDQKTVRESQKRYKSWSKEKIAQLQTEAQSILTRLARLKDQPIEHPEVQQLVKEYHRHMENYYHLTREIFLGLAELYVLDKAFTAYYEKISVGLADYVSRAMQYYCNTDFKEIS